MLCYVMKQKEALKILTFYLLSLNTLEDDAFESTFDEQEITLTLASPGIQTRRRPESYLQAVIDRHTTTNNNGDIRLSAVAKEDDHNSNSNSSSSSLMHSPRHSPILLVTSRGDYFQRRSSSQSEFDSNQNSNGSEAEVLSSNKNKDDNHDVTVIRIARDMDGRNRCDSGIEDRSGANTSANGSGCSSDPSVKLNYATFDQVISELKDEARKKSSSDTGMGLHRMESMNNLNLNRNRYNDTNADVLSDLNEGSISFNCLNDLSDHMEMNDSVVGDMTGQPQFDCDQSKPLGSAPDYSDFRKGLGLSSASSNKNHHSLDLTDL